MNYQVVQKSDGKYYVVDDSGNVVKGPFSSELTASLAVPDSGASTSKLAGLSESALLSGLKDGSLQEQDVRDALAAMTSNGQPTYSKDAIDYLVNQNQPTSKAPVAPGGFHGEVQDIVQGALGTQGLTAAQLAAGVTKSQWTVEDAYNGLIATGNYTPESAANYLKAQGAAPPNWQPPETQTLRTPGAAPATNDTTANNGLIANIEGAFKGAANTAQEAQQSQQPQQPSMTFPAAVEQWRSTVAKYFPPDQVDRVLYLINRESGGDPTAHNLNPKTNDDSYGLLQINLVPGAHQGQISPQDAQNPEKNIAFAAQLYKDQGFAPWATGPGQVYGDFPGSLAIAGGNGSSGSSGSDVSTQDHWVTNADGTTSFVKGVPKSQMTLQEQQAANLATQNTYKAQADAAVGQYVMQHPGAKVFKNPDGSYRLEDANGSAFDGAFDNSTGTLQWQYAGPVGGKDIVGGANVGSFSTLDPATYSQILAANPSLKGVLSDPKETQALLSANPKLAALAYQNAHGGQTGSDAEITSWLGESRDINGTSADAQDLQKNLQTEADTGSIYRDRTAVGGVGTNTAIDKAVSLGSTAAGITELNPANRALYDNPTTHNLTLKTPTPNATSTVGDVTYPVYSTIPFDPTNPTLGGKIANATSQMIQGKLGTAGEGYGVVQSGNPLGAGTGPYSAHEAKIAGDATGGPQNDTSGPGTPPADRPGTADYERDYSAGYSDGAGGKPASGSSQGYAKGYQDGKAAAADSLKMAGPRAPANMQQNNISQETGGYQANPGTAGSVGSYSSSFGPNDVATTLPSSSGSYSPPAYHAPAPPPPAPEPTPAPAPDYVKKPVIYQATGGVDYAGGSTLPQFNGNGFTTPEEIHMVGARTGKVYGVAGEAGPEAINVQPMTSTLPPQIPVQATPDVITARQQVTRPRPKVKISLGG